MERKTFYKNLGDVLSKESYISKPFLTILRNSAIFDQKKIDEIDKGLAYKLNERKEDLDRHYAIRTLPPVEQILNIASGRNYNNLHEWKYIELGELKRKLRKAIETNHLPFDQETLNSIRDKGNIDKEKLIAKFRLNNQRIDTFREKSTERIREKQAKYLMEYLDFMGGDFQREIELYYDFFLEAIGDKSFWNSYNYFKKEYTPKHERMGLALKTISPDVFGIKRIELDQKFANERMASIVGSLQKLNRSGMEVIIDLVDDNREKIKEDGKVGGLHIPMIDKGIGLHPIEIQYQGPMTAVYDLCGKHAHHLYELRQQGYVSKLLKKLSGPLL